MKKVKYESRLPNIFDQRKNNPHKFKLICVCPMSLSLEGGVYREGKGEHLPAIQVEETNILVGCKLKIEDSKCPVTHCKLVRRRRSISSDITGKTF